jgi:hypothetical protein
MKVAICISGQPRAYNKGYEYLKKNLLDRYDCDIFIHTWNNSVYDIQDVVSLYKPISYISEDYPFSFDHLNNKYVNTPNALEFPAANTVFAYYSLFKSCSLKTDHEIKTSSYDWVVKTRFDYALNGCIPFLQLDRSKLYIPNCRMVPSRDFGNDQFAFGSSEIMNMHMTTYINLDFYYKTGFQMNGEEMMQANLRYHGLTGPRLEYVNMNNPFPPGPYNGTTHSLIRDDNHLWKRK